MGKKVTAYRVNSLANIKTENYIDGDIFITSKSIAILIDGQLTQLAKKDDLKKLEDKGAKK